MASSRVIKLSRDDQHEASVLVQITQTGPHPLDVKLEASEGEAPYFATIKHDRAASLRAKHGPVSEAEWKTILHSVFSQEASPDIRATAAVEGGSSLQIMIRKQIQGITQRLGSIQLKCDPSRGIDVFQWCISSQDALEKSNQALAGSLAHAKELEATVGNLRSQLDELVAAKQDDETALLHKFRDLLNEKKVKIREQQRIIAAASFKSRDQSSPSKASPSTSPPVATKSRPAKRKAPETVLSEESSDQDDFEPTGATQTRPRVEESSDAHSMTNATASGGDDDDDDDDDSDTQGVPARKETRSEAKSSARKENFSGSAAAKSGGPAEAPPPRRSLPFSKKTVPETKAVPAPTQSNIAMDDNDDGEDDEL